MNMKRQQRCLLSLLLSRLFCEALSVIGDWSTGGRTFRSIHTDCYNHITATYYLLIERHLRKHLKKRPQLEESARTARSHPFSGMSRRQSTLMSFNSANPHLEPLMLSPRYGYYLPLACAPHAACVVCVRP